VLAGWHIRGPSPPGYGRLAAYLHWWRRAGAGAERYQRHKRRAEHWFVVTGQGMVTLDGGTIEVRGPEIPPMSRGAAHRIQNTGSAPLVFVEVQQGDYYGEDDIVRLDDDYGRLEPQSMSAD